jgi:hypothetical protein
MPARQSCEEVPGDVLEAARLARIETLRCLLNQALANLAVLLRKTAVQSYVFTLRANGGVLISYCTDEKVGELISFAQLGPMGSRLDLDRAAPLLPISRVTKRASTQRDTEFKITLAVPAMVGGSRFRVNGSLTGLSSWDASPIPSGYCSLPARRATRCASFVGSHLDLRPPRRRPDQALATMRASDNRVGN